MFDNPLSSRFDENDAVLYFDEVKVPWERVFVAGDIAMCQKQFHATPAHVYQNYQCQIRLMVKLRFLTGLARMIATANGIERFPQVRETLGQLAAEAAMVEALVRGHGGQGQPARRVFRARPAHALRRAGVDAAALSESDRRRCATLAGGSMIMLPSGVEDFADAEAGRLRSARARLGRARSREQRVKLFKLAWDAVGSEFASRHTQYEMFYAGADFVTKGHSYRTYDWDGATGTRRPPAGRLQFEGRDQDMKIQKEHKEFHQLGYERRLAHSGRLSGGHPAQDPGRASGRGEQEGYAHAPAAHRARRVHHQAFHPRILGRGLRDIGRPDRRQRREGRERRRRIRRTATPAARPEFITDHSSRWKDACCWRFITTTSSGFRFSAL